MTWAGFGRKMYTDYEIVCKVRHYQVTLALLSVICLLPYSRPISLHLSFGTQLFAGATLISRHSVTFLNTSPHGSISRLSLAKFSPIDSLTKSLRRDEKVSKGSSVSSLVILFCRLAALTSTYNMFLTPFF